MLPNLPFGSVVLSILWIGVSSCRSDSVSIGVEEDADSVPSQLIHDATFFPIFVEVTFERSTNSFILPCNRFPDAYNLATSIP